MDKEKLDAIREYVNSYKDSLLGHWTESEQLMILDLLNGYDELKKRINLCFFRTITINKWSESVPEFYIETVEVKKYKNDGEIEIRVHYNFPSIRNTIRIPMLENGDCEINKVFTLFYNIDREKMIKIAHEVLT